MSITLNASTSSGFVQSADNSGEIELQSNGTTALKVNTNEGIQILNCLGVGNATPSTSGAGITFPATQSASTDANTLDDYEEGTWTPNQGSGLTVVGTFSSSGLYTKIGNLVYIAGQVNSTTTVACNATGTITSNLPFTVGASLTTGGALNATQTSATVTYCTATRMDSPNSISASTNIFFSAVYRV